MVSSSLLLTLVPTSFGVEAARQRVSQGPRRLARIPLGPRGGGGCGGGGVEAWGFQGQKGSWCIGSPGIPGLLWSGFGAGHTAEAGA
jgi:hypothetical protein